MRTCHACNREFDTASLVTGKCPHCGAVLRKIAQRTIDDARVLGDAAKSQDIELIIEGSDDDLKDTDQGSATIELNSFFDLDAYRKDQPPSGEHSLELVEDSGDAKPSPPKTPTIGDGADMTMEFQSLSALAPTDESQAATTDRVTHNFESDKTIDLDMMSEDVSKLDSQWRDTIDPGAKHGQTIRQRETVSGFRSSLPV
jgi:hypothetical protein